MEKIMAGIVLFNPEIERLTLEIESIRKQVGKICLFNNGSNNIAEIKEKLSEYNNVTVFLDSTENKGIGYASNRLLEYAEQNNFDYVLLLDHDTICPENIISEYKKYLYEKDVAIFCPCVIDKDAFNRVWAKSSDKPTEEVERCIQSGTLVDVNAWRIVGGFNEWMFVDFVDFDFCKKVRINQYKILRCNEVKIDHQLGQKVKGKLAPFFEKLYSKTKIKFFGYLTYKNAFSAARIYYCTRNNIAYIKLYKNYIKRRREWLDFYKRTFKRIFRGKHRFMIIRETFHGIKDGFSYEVSEYVPSRISKNSKKND